MMMRNVILVGMVCGFVFACGDDAVDLDSAQATGAAGVAGGGDDPSAQAGGTAGSAGEIGQNAGTGSDDGEASGSGEGQAGDTGGEGEASDGGIRGEVPDRGEPVPETRCGECADGQICALVQVQCFAPPCDPVPECVEESRADEDPCLVTLCPEDTACRARRGRVSCVPIEEAGGGEDGPSCGSVTCEAGQVCCNESCGVCTPPDGFCTQQICAEEA